MDISEHYDAIAQCNKCGFCQVACPIFRSTGHESGVARGRLALLRALIEGRLDWNKELEEPLYDCLGCGACCRQGGPALHGEDLALVRSRQLRLDDLITVRQGELAFQPLATTATMLQKATETNPPNLNAVWNRIRIGPSVQRKMWNSSRYFSRNCFVMKL